MDVCGRVWTFVDVCGREWLSGADGMVEFGNSFYKSSFLYRSGLVFLVKKRRKRRGKKTQKKRKKF